MILTALFFNGTEEEAKKFFAPLITLGPLVDMTSVVSSSPNPSRGTPSRRLPITE